VVNRTLACVLPDRIVSLFEEEGGVTGILRVDVDLAGGNRLAHDRRRAELDAIDGLDVVGIEHGKDDVAENTAFGVDLRGDDDIGAGRGSSQSEGKGSSDKQSSQAHEFVSPSKFAPQV